MSAGGVVPDLDLSLVSTRVRSVLRMSDQSWKKDTIPAFAQTYSGAILEACFGKAQLDGSRKRVLALLKEASTRSPRDVVYELRDFMMRRSEMGHSTSWDQRDVF
jgi:hypothetical protein